MQAIRHLIVVAASLPTDEGAPEGISPDDSWGALADRMHKASDFLALPLLTHFDMLAMVGALAFFV